MDVWVGPVVGVQVSRADVEQEGPTRSLLLRMATQYLRRHVFWMQVVIGLLVWLEILFVARHYREER